MWKLKVLIQFILSRLPMGENVNYLLQKVNKSHMKHKTEERIIGLLENLRTLNEYLKLENSTVVEIGTGWDAINAVLLYLMGAKTVHTYDHVPHLRFELVNMVIEVVNSKLGQAAEIAGLSEKVLSERLQRITACDNLEEILMKANILYHAPGDAAQTKLENDSVDLVYSYAVFEHVPENVVHELAIESKRILKKTGFNFHVIGLHDHYNAADKKVSKVNFLKYSEKVWAFWVYNSISYHNRIREKQFIEIWKSHGANVLWKDNKTDPQDIERLKNMKIDKRFEGMTHEELAVYYTKIIFSF